MRFQERVGSISTTDPFERLIDELLLADVWLSTVPAPRRRHSFSIGIGEFVGSVPVFVLVSNFEQVFRPPAPAAATALSVFRYRPTEPATFVSGQTDAVTPPERRRLAKPAGSHPGYDLLPLRRRDLRGGLGSGAAGPPVATPRHDNPDPERHVQYPRFFSDISLRDFRALDTYALANGHRPLRDLLRHVERRVLHGVAHRCRHHCHVERLELGARFRRRALAIRPWVPLAF
jgi:hypothetical protein